MGLDESCKAFRQMDFWRQDDSDDYTTQYSCYTGSSNLEIKQQIILGADDIGELFVMRELSEKGKNIFLYYERNVGGKIVAWMGDRKVKELFNHIHARYQ